MSDKRGPNPVVINKYPNRRFYDTMNSRHVTLQEIHDLIISGKDVAVTDTGTGEDLTNVVLLQILLERDHLKLDLFPSSVMHMMIRSSRNTLRNTVEKFFGPFLGIMAASQKQFDAYLRETMKNMSPLDWTKGMFRAFSPDGVPDGQSTKSVPEENEADHARGSRGGSSDVEELREQMDLLHRRVADLLDQGAGRTRKQSKAQT